MILYQYHCDGCGTDFEAFRRMAESSSADCPHCGASASKTITVPRFILDGTDPAFSTAWERWGKDHERRATDGKRKLAEHGSER